MEQLDLDFYSLEPIRIKVDKVIYGKIEMYRLYCPLCKNRLLDSVGDFYCECGFSIKRNEWDRLVYEAITKRYNCPAHIRRELKSKQNGKCYWCNRPLGTLYEKDGKIKTLKIHYDHKVPFYFIRSNPDRNWCIACNICNLFKRNRLYRKESKMREYLLKKWDEKLKKKTIMIIGNLYK